MSAQGLLAALALLGCEHNLALRCDASMPRGEVGDTFAGSGIVRLTLFSGHPIDDQIGSEIRTLIGGLEQDLGQVTRGRPHAART